MVAITAQVKYRPLYICEVCGRTEQGETVRGVFNCLSLDDFKELITNEINSPSSHSMPVGWGTGHGYRGNKRTFICPDKHN